jgi:hypothetical protein
MSLKGPVEWPHLESLFGGYLHQDFTVEHGSASNAVQAWLNDATPKAAAALSSEWRTFLNVTHGQECAARARVLQEEVGGSWEPADDAEFEVVSALLMQAWRR